MPETLVEREGRAAILTVNRPDKLNALNQQVRDEAPSPGRAGERRLVGSSS
jgi:enoyl-CoA hydratase/carnithine racemase